ncbi:glyoxalase/bleomycin resistance/extradiol dioxygenase family protein [Elioraea tepidiphila]|jgi:PhnB protein|uniref:VOC family protein n=1 Tax=Elioraea tepidiphila TaxID=457934 RepID=UPI002FD8F3A9
MPNDAPSATTCPDAAVMNGVIPYLGLNGRAGEAAEFYARAFGARELGRYPDEQNPGRFMHVQIEINGGALMMTDQGGCNGEPTPSPQGFHLQLVVADGDLWWSRALAAGCTVAMPFERQFWGDRWGMLRDPFGLHWAINEAAG